MHLRKTHSRMFQNKNWQHTDGYCFRRSASDRHSPGAASKLFQAGNNMPRMSTEHLLKKAPAKSCELDPVPTWLLKQLAPHIAPTICHLCNLSLKSLRFSSTTQTRSCSATTEEINHGPRWSQLISANLQPSLPILAYINERVVANWFCEHLTTFSLLPAQQSAYRSFHSTETALQYTRVTVRRTNKHWTAAIRIALMSRGKSLISTRRRIHHCDLISLREWYNRC